MKKSRETDFLGLENDRRQLLIAVLLAMLLSSLDQNITLTAMPTIIEQLGGFDVFSWVFTAYMLTSTVAIMLSGKLGDMKGRKPVYTYGILLFMLGSVLAGFSQSMIMLIVFRAIQGIGGGVMIVSSRAIISDIFPPVERAKWQGVTGAVFAFSSVIGPILGALITESIGWRWVFYVNIPLGFWVLYLLSKSKEIQIATHSHNLDMRGAFWFTLFAVPLLLYLVSWFGSTDLLHIMFLVISFISLGLFIREEQRTKEPILSPRLFSNNSFVISLVAVFVIAMANYGVVNFLPVLMEGVLSERTSVAGAALTPLILAIVVSSVISGQVISRTNRYKLIGVGGCVLMSVGLYLLTSLHLGSTYAEVIAAVIIFGAGIGITMPLFLIVVQNTFDNSKIGMVTSSIFFFRSFGGVLGVATIGAAINSSGDLNSIKNPQDRGVLLSGLHNSFSIILLLSAIPLVMMLLLDEVPLRKTHGEVTHTEEAGLELAEEEGGTDEERGNLAK